MSEFFVSGEGKFGYDGIKFDEIVIKKDGAEIKITHDEYKRMGNILRGNELKALKFDNEDDYAPSWGYLCNSVNGKSMMVTLKD